MFYFYEILSGDMQSCNILSQNNLRNSALHVVSEEQRKADDNVLRLVEEQKV